MSKIILLIGPTASGKTKISVALAKYFNAEIFNCDSRYLYKEPSIATAKVTNEEMEGIKHHMIDIISLNDDYSIYDYQKNGRELLDRLISENKNIIIVGGSGLYVKALLYNYELNDNVIDNIDFSNLTNEELKSKIDDIDKNNNIHINNRQRMERYLNHYMQTGKTLKKTDKINEKVYDFDTILLDVDREVIYNRINQRVEEMFDNGLLEEANKLKDLKHFKDIIGYKELIPYYSGNISLDEAKDEIKKDTRHYAKRQFTWFNNQMKDVNVVKVNYNDINSTINEIIKIIEKSE